jgi:hypothetical protein
MAPGLNDGLRRLGILMTISFYTLESRVGLAFSSRECHFFPIVESI